MGKVTVSNMNLKQALSYEFGRAKRTVKKVAKAISTYKRPQGSRKARQRAWYESSKGKFPTK